MVFISLIVTFMVTVVSVFIASVVMSHVVALGVAPLIAWCIAVLTWIIAGSIISFVINLITYAAFDPATRTYAASL